MKPDKIRELKRLIVIGLFSDDDLMDTLVLKGGNAIDLIHNVAMRSSIDLDFSLESDFPRDNLEALAIRFQRLISQALQPKGYIAIESKMKFQPPAISAEMESFWGGYLLQFKIVPLQAIAQFEANSRDLRMSAICIHNDDRKFRVEFSRHEFCEEKQLHELDGYGVYVYSPEMIICEKLRAICQQMPQYRELVRSHSGRSRARDFFDIYCLVKCYNVNLQSSQNLELLKNIFSKKHVPLNLLHKISDYRELHRLDFLSVLDALKPGTHVLQYDDYFDFVVSLVNKLETLRDM